MPSSSSRAQARLGVAGRRRRRVPLGIELPGVEPLAPLDAGQPALGVIGAGLVVTIGARALVAGLDVGAQEAREGDRASTGGELDRLVGAAAAGEPDADRLPDRVGHLRGDGPLPDQLVEAELVAGQL